MHVETEVVSIRFSKRKLSKKNRENKCARNKIIKCLLYASVLFINVFIAEGYSSTRACGKDIPVFYDPGNNICCNGTVLPLRSANNSEYGCCSRTDLDGVETQVVYDKNIYLCCGAQLVPLYDGFHKRQCCRGADESRFPGKIQEKGSFCCSGQVHKLEDDESCCGAAKYDFTKYMCCDEYGEQSLHKYNPGFKFQMCCGNQTFDEGSHWCDRSVLPPEVRSLTIDRCYDTLYDTTVHLCCDDGTLLKKPVADIYNHVTYRCCNKRLIDTVIESCCPAIPDRNVVEHAMPKGNLCCGNASVRNIPTEKCCQGVVNRLPPDAPNEAHKCCGTKYVRDVNCCNGKEISPEFACCGGVEYSKNSALDCCGEEVIDTNHDVCCEWSSALKHVVPKNKPDDTDCCMPVSEPYNRFTHNCTKNGVLEKPETRNAKILNCPFCRRQTQPLAYCRARNIYQLEVQRVRFTPSGSVLQALLTDTNTPIEIRMPFRCPCIRENISYLVLTRRKLRNNKLKLKSKSMFFKQDRHTLITIGLLCNMDTDSLTKRMKKTVKRLAKRAAKKRTV